MSFNTLHTDYGLQRLAQAEATGSQIFLTHMAVGDGNGNATNPSQSQTALVRERFRAPINRVFQDPTNPQRFSVELIIPASVGGFTMREMGVFDADGSLFAVGNLPATYKPETGEGAFSDTGVILDFMVSNASTINISIDPNVVIVTQQWVMNNITAGALIPGGTTGQVLSKRSNADGDTVWIDPTEANVVVDTIAEKQTLADSQTIVDLTMTITYGLAVYIEGVRIPRGSGADEWQPDPSVPTKLTLGKSYPAGTVFQGVNNEPAGSAPAPLERNRNLSDLASTATARENLNVYSREETYSLARQQAPASMVGYFSRTTAPVGWLKANGAAVSRVVYADLFAAIGTLYGNGDGINTFNLPDYRGEFIRCWDDGRGVDSGRDLGTWRNDEMRRHNHSITLSHEGGGTSDGVGYPPVDGTGPFIVHSAANPDGSWSNATGAGNPLHSTGGNETRPRSFALLACIKY